MTTPKRTTSDNTPPWQAGPDSENLSFGTWLRQQREIREVGLREVAESSKISIRYLEAFEQDRYDLLPAQVFTRGFLRQYALYVGLDPDEVFNYFLWAQRETETPEEDSEEPTTADLKGDSSALPWVIAGGIVFLLAVIALLVWGFSGDRNQATSQQQPVEAFVPVPQPTPPPPAPEPEPETPQEPGAPLQVALEFINNCWVEAVVDDGERRIAQEFAQGESLQIDAQRVVVFRKLGNAGGVKMEVNGQEYPLDGVEGQLKKDLVINLSVAQGLSQETGGEGGDPRRAR